MIVYYIKEKDYLIYFRRHIKYQSRKFGIYIFNHIYINHLYKFNLDAYFQKHINF